MNDDDLADMIFVKEGTTARELIKLVAMNKGIVTEKEYDDLWMRCNENLDSIITVLQAMCDKKKGVRHE